MKAKTFLELVTLSANIYAISKETHLLDRLKDLSEDGKDKINEFMKEKVLDEDGNEVEFIDRLLKKAHEAKIELDKKIQGAVVTFYDKINVTHTDQLKEMEVRMEQMAKDLALAEARINHLENKG